VNLVIVFAAAGYLPRLFVSAAGGSGFRFDHSETKKEGGLIKPAFKRIRG
jgi:hypothetical protein